MHGRIIKLKTCPECGAATDGKSCRCGWTKRGLKKAKRNIPTCKRCNLPGDHGGFCEMHHEQQAEHFYKKRQAEYEKALKPKLKQEEMEK